MVNTRLLNDLLSRVRDIGKRLDGSSKSEECTFIQQCELLLNLPGEAKGLAQAQAILDRYSQLGDDDKAVFFNDIMQRLGANTERLGAAIKTWQQQQDQASARALHFASEPRSQDLFRRLNQAPGATHQLVQMRSDLLCLAKKEKALLDLDSDLAHLFASWFNRGFLELHQIDWGTSAEVLEKIISYEAVHEINGWDDLRQRVGAADRRLYGYFHPALGTEPLIFVEVALTTGVPGSIQSILEHERHKVDPQTATTAVFYSISNCQSGLKGISFGNFLIKQVVETLRQEFPNLETFITLSPIPGLKLWACEELENSESILSEEERSLVQLLSDTTTPAEVIDRARDNPLLQSLVAKYLVIARSPNGGAADPVARFHLGNGARLEQLHLLADTTDKGLSNAWGCMVNYQYHVKDIEKNHEAYVNDNRVVASKHITHHLSMR